MTYSDIAIARFVNQYLSKKAPATTPKELLGRMGPMQAQDYQMAKWAIGIRLPGSTKETIEKAIRNGEIIRTHLLRPTWHFVAADDLRWMLDLTSPRIKVTMRSRHKSLGLTDEIIAKSNRVIEKALTENPLTRNELVAELEASGFENKDNLASHLLLCAELEGIICSGPSKDDAYTYALLEERVPKSKSLSREEALYNLACIYFRSHGPATLEDFCWWSGLTKTGAREALESAKMVLVSEKKRFQNLLDVRFFFAAGY